MRNPEHSAVARKLPPPELEQVAAGVYGYLQPDGSWMVNNAGLVAGESGDLILIDTSSTEARSRAILRVGRDLSTRAPRILVNTHHHGDHTFGNWLLPDSTTVVGHVRCREEVLSAQFLAAEVLGGPDYGHLEVRPPDLTFTDRLALHCGSRELDLRYVGPAHTNNDVVVWLPEDGVLFSGDICFAGGQPFLVEGSVAGYLEALDAVEALEPEVLVPGHGPIRRGRQVATLLDEMRAYVTFVGDIARDGHTAGRTPLEVALAHRDNPYREWQESERLVANLHRAYAELDGLPRTTRLDLAAIWPEMVAFHGGPIPCHA